MWTITSDDYSSVADPTNQNFLNFMHFLGKFVWWRLPMEGWRPLLQEILDPRLQFCDLGSNGILSGLRGVTVLLKLCDA